MEKDSAVIGCQHEVQTYLDANHRQMVKFVSRVDENYQTVRGFMREIIEDKIERLAVEGDSMFTPNPANLTMIGVEF